MKFFFDARYIRTVGFHDGVSRYSTELAHALYELDSSITFIISSDAQRKFLPSGAAFLTFHAVTSWKEPMTALILNKYKPDVVATPLQTMGSFGRHFKLILNQQDMTYYRLPTPPSNMSWVVRMLWRLYHLSYWPGRWTLNAADCVATVSETSKHEIEAAKLTKRPIIVVPNAARDLSSYLNEPVKQYTQPPANIVYMGSLFVHKNVETLIAAMTFLPGRTLHILSRVTPSRKAELSKLFPTGSTVMFHNGVSDEIYAEILSKNAIMASATKSEGFNLNLAEALKLGVPCVFSDIPVHHEVAGDGALFADPRSPKDFAEKITSLDNVAVREALIAKGQAHIQKFSWQHSAHVLLSAARDLVR